VKHNFYLGRGRGRGEGEDGDGIVFARDDGVPHCGAEFVDFCVVRGGVRMCLLGALGAAAALFKCLRHNQPTEPSRDNVVCCASHLSSIELSLQH